VRGVSHAAPAQGGRLLRVLLVRIDSVPTDPKRELRLLQYERAPVGRPRMTVAKTGLMPSTRQPYRTDSTTTPLPQYTRPTS
jgi:hypothetical protein